MDADMDTMDLMVGVWWVLSSILVFLVSVVLGRGPLYL